MFTDDDFQSPNVPIITSTSVMFKLSLHIASRNVIEIGDTDIVWSFAWKFQWIKLCTYLPNPLEADEVSG